MLAIGHNVYATLQTNNKSDFGSALMRDVLTVPTQLPCDGKALLRFAKAPHEKRSSQRKARTTRLPWFQLTLMQKITHRDNGARG